LITLSEICACAAPLDRSVAAAAASTCFVIVFITSSPSGCQRGKTGRGAAGGLDAEVLVQHAHLAVEFGGGEALDDAAMFHDVEAVGQRRRETEVLFDHHDGEAALAQRADGARER